MLVTTCKRFADVCRALVVFAAIASPGVAFDPENCLLCHRYRGLSRIDSETGHLRLFSCDVEYYTESQGAHARLRCTGCHERQEVAVVPHRVETPVDCTRQCHIVSETGLEILFSHEDVQEHLEGSVHSGARLTGLPFDRPLLRPGQSRCLYCHDEPVFRAPIGRFAGLRWAHGNSRCDTCHGEELPVASPYFIKHVTSRLQPARPIRQLVQVCAVCHSDPAVVAHMETHDTVASYLHSFHGKASLLGSTQTATCLDCHASETGNVHEMLGKENPASSVHPAGLSTTCRTEKCHPGAPPGMSQAAVHLDLDPRARTPEFYVAAAFVSLTAGVMIVFFALIMLQLLNVVVRRRNPEHDRLVRLASELQETREGRRLLERLTVHERLQHWVLAGTFILLVATGMPIKFADADWASELVRRLGGLTQVRAIHRICAVGMLGAFFYHIGYLLVCLRARVARNRREGVREGWLQTIRNAPAMLRAGDFVDFGRLIAHLLFVRKEPPRFGRFNFMQKFEYWAVFWGIPVMGLSGLILWGAGMTSEHLTGRGMNFAFIIHSDEAYLAFVYIAVVHVFSIILAPAVFPLSLGTITGQAPAEELAEGHRGFVAAAAEKLSVSVSTTPATRRGIGAVIKGLIVRTYAAGLLCLCAFLCFVMMRFLFALLLTRQSAPAEIVEIPKRLDADSLTAIASGSRENKGEGTGRPRSPLAHYHQIPAWFQADPGNDCTTSGCHTPLPHGDRIEVRAFLNMHGTFLDCAVCHLRGEARAQQARWLRLADGQAAPPPALLRLAGRFEQWNDVAAADAPAVKEELIGLLTESLADAGENARLRSWLLRLETTNTQGQLWRSLVEEIRYGLRTHTHGEYGAKIGLYDKAGERLGKLTGEQRAAADRFLAEGDRLSLKEHHSLRVEIHKGTRASGTSCASCHAPEPKLVDFQMLGYPQDRLEALQGSEIVRQILSIDQGQPFHLPQLLEGNDGG